MANTTRKGDFQFIKDEAALTEQLRKYDAFKAVEDAKPEPVLSRLIVDPERAQKQLEMDIRTYHRNAQYRDDYRKALSDALNEVRSKVHPWRSSYKGMKPDDDKSKVGKAGNHLPAPANIVELEAMKLERPDLFAEEVNPADYTYEGACQSCGRWWRDLHTTGGIRRKPGFPDEPYGPMCPCGGRISASKYRK